MLGNAPWQNPGKNGNTKYCKATLPFCPKTTHFLKACSLGYFDSRN